LLEQGNLPNLVKGTTTHGEYCRYTKTTTSDTQGGFRLLHQPLGQLARKALNLPPKIDTKRYSVRSNQIAALISQ